jgi:hypothetical protein
MIVDTAAVEMKRNDETLCLLRELRCLISLNAITTDTSLNA